jgi:hypothetical protein
METKGPFTRLISLHVLIMRFYVVRLKKLIKDNFSS